MLDLSTLYTPKVKLLFQWSKVEGSQSAGGGGSQVNVKMTLFQKKIVCNHSLRMALCQLSLRSVYILLSLALTIPLKSLSDQGVSLMSPVEAFATAIKFFDLQKPCLIAQSFPSEALDCLISKGQRSNSSHMFLIVDF